MASTTMAAGSQPASMPAESNLDPMIQLISPARSGIFEDAAMATATAEGSTDPGVTYQPIEELIAAYEELE